MNKNTKLALYAVGAVLGVVGITRILRKRESNEEVQNALDTEQDKGTVETVKNPNTDFIEKKKLLQSILGFTGNDVDGIIGDKTKAKLAELGLSTSVTTANINSLIEQARKTLQAKQAKLESDKAKQIAQSTNKARIAQAQKLLTALNKQGVSKNATWIDNNARLPFYKKDVFGTFIAQPNDFLDVKKNENIRFFKGEVTSNGFLRLNTATNMWLSISPYSVTIF
jgi:hypothetical protein